VRPLLPETRTVVASGSLASLTAVGRDFSNQLFPVAVELLSPRLAKHLEIEAAEEDCALLVRFAGSSRGVVSQTAQALKFLREDEDNRCAALDEDESLWRKLSEAPLQSSENLGWRVVLRPTDLISFLKDVTALEKDEASHLSLLWHAGLGDGRMRAIARAPVYHREAVRALERLRQQVESLGGNLVIEKAPLEIKHDFDAWGSFGSAAG